MRISRVPAHYRVVRQGKQQHNPDTGAQYPDWNPALPSLSADPKSRMERVLARRRYEALIDEFREDLRADPFAARSAVATLFRPDSLIPPSPQTWRGRLGRLLIHCQSKLMWWTVRSFRMRDNAIESIWLSLELHLREQRRRDVEVSRQLLALDARIRELEPGGRS